MNEQERKIAQLRRSMRNLSKRSKQHRDLTRRLHQLERQLATAEAQQNGDALQSAGEQEDIQRARTMTQWNAEHQALDEDVMALVFEYLTPYQLGKMANVCTFWWKMTHRPALWRDTLVALSFKSARQVAAFGGTHPVVQHLELCGCALERCLSSLAKACPQVCTLSLDRSKFLDADLDDALEHWADSLEFLSVEDSTFENLLTKPGSTAVLRGFNLNGCNNTRDLLWLQRFPQLEVLSLASANPAFEMESEELVEQIFAVAPQLTALNLSDGTVDDEAVPMLAEFAHLCALGLNDNMETTYEGITDTSLITLVTSMGERLTTLLLNQTVSESELEELEDEGAPPEPLITDEVLHALALNCPRLTTIAVGGCRISDEGVTAMAAACPLLTSVDLRCPYEMAVTNASAIALADHCPNLDTLYLRYSRVDDAGVEALANLPKLRCLDLAYTAVSPAGLTALAATTSLRKLCLFGCGKVGAGSQKQFRKTRPDVKVIDKELVDTFDRPMEVWEQRGAMSRARVRRLAAEEP